MNRLVLVIVAIVIVVGVAWLAFMNPKPAAPANTSTSTTNAAATISYTSNGFSPASTTVKSGQQVTFKNTASEDVQVDSNPHPVHTDDTDLNIGVISPGQSQTVTLTKTGTFGFHNHLNPAQQARITIQQ